MSFVTSAISLGKRAAMKIAPKSPVLLVAGGIVVFVAAAVSAGAATIKAKDILKEHRDERECIEEAKKEAEDFITNYSETDNPNTLERASECELYLNSEMKKEKLALYRHTAWRLTKVYSLTFLLVLLGTGLVLTGHHILNARYTAMVGAYTGLQESYANYRKHVADAVGKDKESEIFNAASAKITEQKGDASDIIEKTDLEKVLDVDFYNVYAVRYSKDENPQYYKRNAASAYLWLKGIQCMMNDKLRADGVVTLNDVYIALGYPPIQSGCTLGWVYDKKNPMRSCVVDFGLNTGDYIHNSDPEMKAFIDTASSPDPRNGTNECTLRFNVDPIPIYYAMPKKPNTYVM